MATAATKRRLNRCMRSMLSTTDESNPFAEISDETALIAAAHLIETAALNLASQLPPEDVAELVEISLRLSDFVEGLPGELRQVVEQQRRPN